MELHPFLILFIGVAVVIGMIIGMRINAFVALITAALVVSFLSPGEIADKVSRVASAFGATAGGIGIVIALAAVIGKCLMDSGAADRVVQAFVNGMGEKRSSIALSGSGFVLSIPVFFDTVFYLLVPLARSLYRSTKKNYLKYVLAISAGAAVTHTLVPPTPGPLLMAQQLGVDLGTMIGVGALVGIPAAIVGLLFAGWLDKR
ncbi:GntP family permease, partial [bacterium]|nr:GntP family permease [bacterium]